MSKKVLAKVEFVSEMIENIETVCQRHNGAAEALDDEAEGRAAILMFLLQIGETLKKLDKEIVEKYSLEYDIKGAYDVRNFIAHDYKGVSIGLIKEIIEDNLPDLKTKIENIIDEYTK